MSEGESAEGERGGVGRIVPFPSHAQAAQVTFARDELRAILDVYGRRVASGEWRDYAIDFSRARAVFSIYRRSSELPLYRIVKDPKLARRQGAYALVSASGAVLKRGHDLARVLAALPATLRIVPN